MGTCFETWNCEDFKGYNYGYSDISDMDELEFKPSKRTRKVTITEITDESNIDDNELDFDLNAEELHKQFETVIEDWKIKMEVIIGDGLKKLRKANKERKLMMKYLPGDKRVQHAKIGIAKEWKIDFQKAFGTTHAKLEKLAADKTKQVENIAKTNIKELEINKNKKEVVNIDFSNVADKNESPFGNLKDLIKELDRMCNILQGESPTIHSIPIYSKEARGQLLPAYNNDWLDLQRTMLYNAKDVNLYLNNRQNFLDVLEDFKIKFYNTKDKLKKTSGSRIENTNAVKAQSRMLERKYKKEEFMLRQFKKNGRERFLVIKKKPSENDTIEAEDIFKDWKFNLEDIYEQRKQAAIKARKSRTRKLSNRALRKELIKEINEVEKNKPMSYSDIVKKNIKAPMEDIFEAWRDYLQELDNIINDESRVSFCKGDSMEDILATANCFQKELQDCGQPTIKSVIAPTKPNKLRNVGARHYEKEIYFASWRHNLATVNEAIANDNVEKFKYEAENHFSKWMHNLKEEIPVVEKEAVHDDVENYFEDWIYNFHANELVRSNSKMLKNKQRQQRRSKKKSKSPSIHE